MHKDSSTYAAVYSQMMSKNILWISNFWYFFMSWFWAAGCCLILFSFHTFMSCFVFFSMFSKSFKIYSYYAKIIHFGTTASIQSGTLCIMQRINIFLRCVWKKMKFMRMCGWILNCILLWKKFYNFLICIMHSWAKFSHVIKSLTFIWCITTHIIAMNYTSNEELKTLPSPLSSKTINSIIVKFRAILWCCGDATTSRERRENSKTFFSRCSNESS